MLNENPCPNLLATMQQKDYSPEKFSLNQEHQMIYFVSSSKWKLDTTVFEKHLQVMGTCRNWNTMNKVLKLVVEMENNTAAAPVPITAFFKPKTISREAISRQVTASPPPDQDNNKRPRS